MELDNSATSFIIIILTIVTISYVVYTNYNSIIDMKNKLNKLEQAQVEVEPLMFEEQEPVAFCAEEPLEIIQEEEDCLLSKDWENNVPLFLPDASSESIQLEEMKNFTPQLETIQEDAEPIEDDPLKIEEVVMEPVKPAMKVSVKRRKTKTKQ